MTDLLADYPVLRQAPLLRELAEPHLRGLLGVMRPQPFAPGQVLMREGEAGDSLAVVAAGFLSVTVSGPGGRVEVSTLKPGDVVGEMACLDPAPRSATVTGRTNGMALFMNRAMLGQLRLKGPEVARALVTGLILQVTERIRAVNALLEERLAGLGRRAPGSRPPPADEVLRPQPFKGEVNPDHLLALTDFSRAEREMMLAASRLYLYPPQAELCREGELGNSCFVVIRGEVEVRKLVGGKVKPLAIMKDCLLGQMALVDHSPRSATLRALTPVVALELTRDSFEQLLGRHNPFALHFQEYLAVSGVRQLREATRRLAIECAPARDGGVTARPAGTAAAATVSSPAPPTRGAFPGRGAAAAPEPVRPPPVPPVRRPAEPVDSLEQTADWSEREAAREARRALEHLHPRTQKQAERHTLAYMQASLKEWGMSLEDLDKIEVVRPDGIMSAAERKARLGR